MSAVWERSRATEGALLVNLAMADFAHDDGTGVYPSVHTLAQKARLSDRQVQRILRQLESLGEIEVAAIGGGRRHTSRYTLTPGGDRMSPFPRPTVTPETERVTPTTRKGDADVTRTVSEPSVGTPVSQPDETLKLEVILAYKDQMHFTPPVNVRKEIRDTVTDMALWKQVLKAWQLRGYNPRNVDGMLAWYKQGFVPAQGGKAQPYNPQVEADKYAKAAADYERKKEAKRANTLPG